MIIKEIKTLYRVDKQEIILGFDDNKHQIFTFSELEKKVNLNIFELELLIGFEIIPHYYLKGETNYWGITVLNEESVIKDFTLKENFNREEAYKKNSHGILNFKKLFEIKEIINRNNKHSVLLKFESGEVCYLREKELKAWTGLELKYLPVLVGLRFSPEYFKNGDVMSDFYGKANYCSRDNAIVKSLNLRFDKSELERINKKIGEINNGVLFNSNGIRTNLGIIPKNDKDYDSYGTSYKQYNGYNDWSDDVIKDAFEGDPDATWNVD